MFAEKLTVSSLALQNMGRDGMLTPSPELMVTITEEFAKWNEFIAVLIKQVKGIDDVKAGAAVTAVDGDVTVDAAVTATEDKEPTPAV